ncbi:MAG: hypothetical protein HY234_02045 [Acidobacteria bacterium]|nr:hypothetical protein [Acidobacteriota bacterium]MBI3661821.1 hypothetical protein [Acidobacteriota bacterium]
MALEQAYPGLAFRARSRNWWARLTGTPAECQHLETEFAWMATYSPDTIYLRGRGRARSKPARPEVSVCRTCLLGLLEPELAAYAGRVVAFEPDAEHFTQFFFIAAEDFEPAGLQPEVSSAIETRLNAMSGQCEHDGCARRATWLWLSRTDVASLDDFGSIGHAAGRRLCARHGAAALCRQLASIAEANLFYVNAPYGETGAYVWI